MVLKALAILGFLFTVVVLLYLWLFVVVAREVDEVESEIDSDF